MSVGLPSFRSIFKRQPRQAAIKVATEEIERWQFEVEVLDFRDHLVVQSQSVEFIKQRLQQIKRHTVSRTSKLAGSPFGHLLEADHIGLCVSNL